MNVHNDYNENSANCPGEEDLADYLKGKLGQGERNVISAHLALCGTCMEYAKLLFDEHELNEEPGEALVVDADLEMNITPGLAQALEVFRQREERRREHTPRDLDQVLAGGGLKVGQIWRTESERIVVPGPDSDEYFSFSELNSMPHLTVITNCDAYDLHDRPVIRVAPIDCMLVHASQGDTIIDEDQSPLGYEFMIQEWNQQPMLQENLSACLGAFDPAKNKSLLTSLERLGREALHEGTYSLESIIIQGRFHDPIMRYRAKEFEDTAYLRVPVKALHELVADQVHTSSELENEIDDQAQFIDWRKELRPMVVLVSAVAAALERGLTVSYASGEIGKIALVDQNASDLSQPPQFTLYATSILPGEPRQVFLRLEAIKAFQEIHHCKVDQLRIRVPFLQNEEYRFNGSEASLGFEDAFLKAAGATDLAQLIEKLGSIEIYATNE